MLTLKLGLGDARPQHTHKLGIQIACVLLTSRHSSRGSGPCTEGSESIVEPRSLAFPMIKPPNRLSYPTGGLILRKWIMRWSILQRWMEKIVMKFIITLAIRSSWIHASWQRRMCMSGCGWTLVALINEAVQSCLRPSI